MFIDFHTHPLSHRYYYDGTRPEALTDKDKADIIGLLAVGRERGLDAIGITDHDLALAGLWAKEFADSTALPLKVIPGCECELYYLGEWIHLLALNIMAPLSYTPYIKPAELIAQIKGQGAIAVLAHPMCYSVDVYHSLKGLLDGIEYRNGAQERRGQHPFSEILDNDGYAGLRLYNSDYHYPDKRSEEQWRAGTIMTEQEFSRWFRL
jgi:predicted metal-dependent phosphoesterase TrpH